MFATKRHSLSCALVVLALSLMASTANADRSDYIRQYLESSGLMKGLEGMTEAQARVTLFNMFREHEPSENYKKDFEEVWKDLMREDFSSTGGLFDLMKPMFSDLTDQDLEQIAYFYKTPAGAKLAKINHGMGVYINSIMMPSWRKRIEQTLIPEMLRRLELKGWDHNGERVK